VCEITLIFVNEQKWNQVKFFKFKITEITYTTLKKSVVYLYLFVAGYC